MFNALFKRSTPKPASVPDGVVAYAIGDIHGRADLLRVLVSALFKDLNAERGRRAIVTFLGDYIDRGPASSEVLDILIQLKGVKEIEWNFLRGNHEQALLDFLEDPTAGPVWCNYGGREALASYGIDAPYGQDARLWRQTRDRFEIVIPKEHLEFLSGLELSCEVGDYFFAHAGARPGIDLAKQKPQDLIMIRQSFLDDRRPFDKVVVHGHSAAVDAHSDHRRIGIDTGAYATSVLTALKLVGDQRSLLQTRGDGENGFAVTQQPA